MHKLSITGGIPLKGSISISGSKNATLPILAACLLTSEPVTLSNVPHLRDVTSMLELLGEIGLRFNMTHQGDLKISLEAPIKPYAHHELTQKIRASILVLGPLLTRFRKTAVSLPGGCAIGRRPIDLHVSGLEAMGAYITIKDSYIYAHCPQRLTGAHIHLHTVSVTATENLMMAAVLAQGITTIENAAREPEVIDLAHFLNYIGARITGIGTEILTIEGVEQLRGGCYSILPDRLEAATLLIAAACTRGEITLNKITPQYMTHVLHKLKETGLEIQTGQQTIHLKATNTDIHAIDIHTTPYPGFPTDLQAPIMVLNTTAKGVSKITESIFENRFLHVAELRRMGANIVLDNRTAICTGVAKLIGTRTRASDLRAAASLILAGLMAEGQTTIESVSYIDRGYEYFEEKLMKLGALINFIY